MLYLGHSQGRGQNAAGLKLSLGMTVEILPLLVFALVVAGMVQVLLPDEVVSRWVGTESGIKGILIGSIAGGLTPGGPYVCLPLVAGLLRAGANAGTVVAFLTGWSLFAVARLPMEIGILGWKFTAVRLASTLIFPPIAGLLANLMFSGTKLY